MPNEENESIYRKKKQAHETQWMTAERVNVCTCKNQTSRHRFYRNTDNTQERCASVFSQHSDREFHESYADIYRAFWREWWKLHAVTKEILWHDWMLITRGICAKGMV